MSQIAREKGKVEKNVHNRTYGHILEDYKTAIQNPLAIMIAYLAAYDNKERVPNRAIVGDALGDSK